MSSQRLNLDELRLDPSSLIGAQRPGGFKRRLTGPFLAGPIPWGWQQVAAIQPGKALHVGIVIWRLAGLTRAKTVRLTQTAMDEFRVQRLSTYRAISALEKAGLIAVERHRGRCPIIAILESSG
jgi:hypothetical protein